MYSLSVFTTWLDGVRFGHVTGRWAWAWFSRSEDEDLAAEETGSRGALQPQAMGAEARPVVEVGSGVLAGQRRCWQRFGELPRWKLPTRRDAEAIGCHEVGEGGGLPALAGVVIGSVSA